jgi:superfamily II DNA or RNA helicase
MKVSLARGTNTVAGYLATLRRKLGEVKVKPAIEDAIRAAADGHKVVLWCWHNDVARKVLDSIPSGEAAWRLQASDPAHLREEWVRRFRSHDGPCFLVANIGVGGTALDLSCSDYAIFVELDWTPANMQQAAMRTFHKDRPHTLVYLYADCPVEASVVEALDVKNGFAAAIGLSDSDVARKVLG